MPIKVFKTSNDHELNLSGTKAKFNVYLQVAWP